MIKFPSEYPFSDVDDIGLVLTKVRPAQFHIGILYRNKTGSHEIYHFTGESLKSIPPEGDYCWLDLGACFKRRQRSILLASLWTFIEANESSNVPYGFNSPEGGINLDLTIDNANNRGFTCASFVLSVFDRFSFKLLRYSEWPAAAGADLSWQQFFLNRVIAPLYSQEYADAQSALIGAPRFLPYEVAAATQVSIPAGYAGTQVMGGLVRDLIERFTIASSRQ